jgi:chemosensory pili system protein ChpC
MARVRAASSNSSAVRATWPNIASQGTATHDSAAFRSAVRGKANQRQQRMNPQQNDIRGVMITVTNGRVLLPNATVSEVITFAVPDPVPNAPDWLLGRIRWRGWRLPLVSFARLAGYASTEGELGAKVVVLKALGGNPKLPYFAMLTQGFPRLVTVASDSLSVDDGITELPAGALIPVMLRDDAAVVPDLGQIEALISEALARAA